MRQHAASQADAHETNEIFIRVSGSELVQKYIGEGSSTIRELFTMAPEYAPAIIFMDEVDSIGSLPDFSDDVDGPRLDFPRRMTCRIKLLSAVYHRPFSQVNGLKIGRAHV